MAEGFTINAYNIVMDENGNFVLVLSPTKQRPYQEPQPSELCQENDQQNDHVQDVGPNLLSPERISSTVIWSQNRDRNQKEVDHVATEAFLGNKF